MRSRSSSQDKENIDAKLCSFKDLNIVQTRGLPLAEDYEPLAQLIKVLKLSNDLTLILNSTLFLISINLKVPDPPAYA